MQITFAIIERVYHDSAIVVTLRRIDDDADDPEFAETYRLAYATDELLSFSIVDVTKGEIGSNELSYPAKIALAYFCADIEAETFSFES